MKGVEPEKGDLVFKCDLERRFQTQSVTGLEMADGSRLMSLVRAYPDPASAQASKQDGSCRGCGKLISARARPQREPRNVNRRELHSYIYQTSSRSALSCIEAATIYHAVYNNHHGHY